MRTRDKSEHKEKTNPTVTSSGLPKLDITVAASQLPEARLKRCVDQVKNPRASARTRGASFQQFMLYLWRNSGLWNGRREVPNHFKFDIYIQMTVSSDAGAR